MKTTLTAFALATTLAQPASATTFPSLTTIYVAPGVHDDGGAANTGTATVVSCSNVSGFGTPLRILVLNHAGAIEANFTFGNVPHGGSIRAVTHLTFLTGEDSLDTGLVDNGVINVESLQSGVFCTFTVVPAAGPATGFPLNAIRVNQHPGTVE